MYHRAIVFIVLLPYTQPLAFVLLTTLASLISSMKLWGTFDKTSAQHEEIYDFLKKILIACVFLLLFLPQKREKYYKNSPATAWW